MKNESRLEMVRQIVFAVARQHMPDDLAAMRSIWSFWSARAVCDGQPTLQGLSAVASTDEGSRRVYLLLIVEACVPRNDEAEWPPSEASVEKLGRSVAAQLGLEYPRVQHLALPIAMAARLILAGVQSPVLPGALEPPESVWVEGWKGGAKQALAERSVNERAAAIERAGVELVVDEIATEFQVATGIVPFHHLSLRALRAIWMMLTHTGRAFSLDAVSVLVGPEGANDERSRKCVAEGNEALERLIGRRVLPRAKRGDYYVSPDWSWLWIRVARDPSLSRLRV